MPKRTARTSKKTKKRKSTTIRTLSPKHVSVNGSDAIRGGGINRIVVTDGKA